MSNIALKLKIMPSSPDQDLEKIKQKAKEELEKLKGVLNNFEEKPIAFGLKALIMTAAYPEQSQTDELENAVKGLEGVGSVELIDYRRAIG